jgi:hypothetical protein
MMTIFDTDRGIAIDDSALAVIAKAQADGVETGNPKMLQLAKERQRIFPSKSDAQAYVDVYTDPRNVALKEKVVQENWALSGHAQATSATRRTIATRIPCAFGRRVPVRGRGRRGIEFRQKRRCPCRMLFLNVLPALAANRTTPPVPSRRKIGVRSR